MNRTSPTAAPAPATEGRPSWLARWIGRGSAPAARAEYVAQRQVIRTSGSSSMPSAMSARVGRTGPIGR